MRRKNGRRAKTASTDSEKEEEEEKEEQLERDSVYTTEGEAGEDQSDDDCGKLDRDLERKSRQHNLTAVNVRDILHVGVLNTFYLCCQCFLSHWSFCLLLKLFSHCRDYIVVDSL